MEVNDLVITMLFSSAHGILTICVHNSSRTLLSLHVTPKVRTAALPFSISAARKTSVVFPDRDTSTTCRAPVRFNASSGAKSSSDAGIAVHDASRSVVHCAAIVCER